MDEPFEYRPPEGPLAIVHCDRDLVVVDKPAGLLSVPGRTHSDSASERLERDFERVYAVHRLDMHTSGLLVFALRRKAEADLKRQFRERTVAKTYMAVVHGTQLPDKGCIDAPLRREGGLPPRSVVDPESGKPARTRFSVLHRDAERTRVQLHPETGRSHQLRVHLLSEGHPIVGDPFYGPSVDGAERMLLHAESMTIAHPYSGEPLRLVSGAPF